MTATIRWQDFGQSAGGQILIDLPDLTLQGPQLVLVLGATGSGKSTLLRSGTLAARPPAGITQRGSVERLDEPPTTGYLPQDPLDALLSFDAEHEFLLRARARRLPLAEARQQARTHVSLLGLAGRATVPFHRLSAGERKRVALTAIESHRPALLLVDEPFNHLDPSWRPRLRDALLRSAQDRLVVVATHEPAPLLADAGRVLVLRRGRLAYDGAPPRLVARADEFPELRLRPEPAPAPRFPAAEAPLVVVSDLHHRIGSRRIFEGATAAFGPGIHAILGPNGSGKTTLFRLLAGLEPIQRGRIRVAGWDPARHEPHAMSRVSMLLFEDPTRMLFSSTVEHEVAFAPVNHERPGCDVTGDVRQALFDFELDDLRNRNPFTLSGGERERLALACVAATRTPVVLLDEPTQGLDAPGRRLLYAFLERLAPRTCILVATHDEALAARAHARHRIDEGRILTRGEEAAPRTPS